MFRFFKKKKVSEPEVRMPSRPAVQPRPNGAPVAPAPAEGHSAVASGGERPALPDLEFQSVAPPVVGAAVPQQVAPMAASAAVSARPPAVPAEEPAAAFSMSEFDRGFTRSSVMAIDVNDHLDHLQADVEQVAVIFANGQPDAARSLLDVFIRAYPGGEGERFWRMYLDLLALADDRTAYDDVARRYLEACGGMAPAWRDQPARAAATGVTIRGAIVELGGEVVGQKFNELPPLLKSYSQMVIDFSRVRRIDYLSASQLANQLLSYRKPAQEIIIHAPNQLVAELLAMVGLNTLAEIFVPKE